MKKRHIIIVFILLFLMAFLIGCAESARPFLPRRTRDETRATRVRETEAPSDSTTQQTDITGSETFPIDPPADPTETEDEQDGLLRYRVTRFAPTELSEEGHAYEPFGGNWNVDYENEDEPMYLIIEQPPSSSGYRFTIEGAPISSDRVGAAALASDRFADYPEYAPYLNITDNMILGRFVSFARDVYPVHFREVEAVFDDQVISGQIIAYYGEIVYTTYPEYDYVVTETHIIYFQGVRQD